MKITINKHIIDVCYDRVNVMRKGNRIAKCVTLKIKEGIAFTEMLGKINSITKLDEEMFSLMAEHTHKMA